jgi:hypothetical protein
MSAAHQVKWCFQQSTNTAKALTVSFQILLGGRQQAFNDVWVSAVEVYPTSCIASIESAARVVFGVCQLNVGPKTCSACGKHSPVAASWTRPDTWDPN